MKKNITRRGFIRQCTGGACAIAGAALYPIATSSRQASAQTATRGRLGFKKSPWFVPIDNNALRCTLCPRQCSVDEGKRGFCRVRGNWQGDGYTLVYGNPAIVQIDPIERKPFYHVLPASSSLSAATAGCNVRCKFCEVWDLALVAPEDVHAYNLSPAQLTEHAVQSDVESLCFTFGEPVVFYEYMHDSAASAREEGLLNLLHSNGYIEEKPLNELMELLDGANIDLKAFDRDFYRDIVGGELDPVLKTLKRIRTAGLHLEITNIVIPTLNDKEDDIRKMCEWIRDELGADTPLHFNRFYPLYQLADLPPTPVSTLEKARNAARDVGLNYVYVGNVTGHEGQHTFCAGCGEKIIHRVGFMIDEPKMSGETCEKCGHEIPGIWGA